MRGGKPAQAPADAGRRSRAGGCLQVLGGRGALPRPAPLLCEVTATAGRGLRWSPGGGAWRRGRCPGAAVPWETGRGGAGAAGQGLRAGMEGDETEAEESFCADERVRFVGQRLAQLLRLRAEHWQRYVADEGTRRVLADFWAAPGPASLALRVPAPAAARQVSGATARGGECAGRGAGKGKGERGQVWI